MLRHTHANIIFFAALLAGASYYVADFQMTDTVMMIAFKGSCVGLLAIWAILNVRCRAGWLIALVLALGAVGDVLIETHGLVGGALAFLAGHIVAIYLYLSHRNPTLTSIQSALSFCVVPVSLIIAWQLTGNTDMLPGLLLYTLFLCLMTATAWLSTFPRHFVGLGAALFLVSDLFIFARAGALSASTIPELVIWPAYFGGQALIAFGVVGTLARQSGDLAPSQSDSL